MAGDTPARGGRNALRRESRLPPRHRTPVATMYSRRDYGMHKDHGMHEEDYGMHEEDHGLHEEDHGIHQGV